MLHRVFGATKPFALARHVTIGVVALCCAVGSLLLSTGHVRAGDPAPTISLAQFQQLITVWASGTPQIQQVAQTTCAEQGIQPANCAAISAAVRATWAQLIERDPAAVGQPDVPANIAARRAILAALAAQMQRLSHGHGSELLAATAHANQIVGSAAFVAAARPTGLSGTHVVTVWATSFKQTSGLPRGYNSTRSEYIALPDAYLKYANLGEIGTSYIPAMYQPFYVPQGTTTHWAVAVAAGSRSVSSALVTDVGPWNEDDNWWDAEGTSAMLPANCPVSSALVASDALANALVDGICPNATSSSSATVNLRRIYYYMLYQHYGLPFFQVGGYQPTGSFSDGNFPTALGQNCAEAAAAAANNDGVVCGPGRVGYNLNAGGWLRGGNYDAPIVNQSSIDLSPAIDKALGWVYPSSGLVAVDVSALP